MPKFSNLDVLVGRGAFIACSMRHRVQVEKMLLLGKNLQRNLEEKPALSQPGDDSPTSLGLIVIGEQRFPQPRPERDLERVEEPAMDDLVLKGDQVGFHHRGERGSIGWQITGTI